MKKNDNMDPKSIKSLKEFNEKQIKANIRLHIIFLSMVTIINICLFQFIIMYKNKIREIKKKSNQRKSSINMGEKNIISLDNSIQNKLVNIFSVSNNAFGNPHFSFLFETSEEVEMIKNYISSFSQIEEPTMTLAYQGINDSDDTRIILDIINYFQNTLFVIGTRNGDKFAFYYQNAIHANNKGYYASYNNRCFIISFLNKEKYNCLDNRETFSVNKNSLFNIGEGDIVINYNFLTKGGIINFPFKSFDVPGNVRNVFTKYNGEFEIKDIEIYLIF